MARTSASLTARPRGLRRLLFLRPRALLRFFRDARASLGSKVILGAALAYLVLPVDLIPDVAPVVGWLDDAGFMAIAFGFVLRQLARYEAEAEAPAA